jgi:hypothetical protein
MRFAALPSRIGLIYQYQIPSCDWTEMMASIRTKQADQKNCYHWENKFNYETQKRDETSSLKFAFTSNNLTSNIYIYARPHEWYKLSDVLSFFN